MLRKNKKNRNKILLTTGQSYQEIYNKLNNLIDSNAELNNRIDIEFNKNMKELDERRLKTSKLASMNLKPF